MLFNLERYAELGVAGISIGSNDLTQLLLGADRDSELLAEVFDERDPAVADYLRELIPRARELGPADLDLRPGAVGAPRVRRAARPRRHRRDLGQHGRRRPRAPADRRRRAAAAARRGARLAPLTGRARPDHEHGARRFVRDALAHAAEHTGPAEPAASDHESATHAPAGRPRRCARPGSPYASSVAGSTPSCSADRGGVLGQRAACAPSRRRPPGSGRRASAGRRAIRAAERRWPRRDLGGAVRGHQDEARGSRAPLRHSARHQHRRAAPCARRRTPCLRSRRRGLPPRPRAGRPPRSSRSAASVGVLARDLP